MLLLVRTLPERLIQPSHVHFKLTLNFSFFLNDEIFLRKLENWWSGCCCCISQSAPKCTIFNIQLKNFFPVLHPWTHLTGGGRGRPTSESTAQTTLRRFGPTAVRRPLRGRLLRPRPRAFGCENSVPLCGPFRRLCRLFAFHFGS